MAADGAAISLKSTIQHILQSSRISLVPPSPQILQPAYDAMARLQEVLLKLDETGYSKIRTEVNDLDDRIKEVIWEFEDLLESNFYNQILPQLESERDHLSFSLDLQSLRQSVDGFVERVTAMEAEYDVELLNMPEEEGEPMSSRIDYGGINSEMVGSYDEFEQARDHMLAEDEKKWLSVIGMAGVGKTTLAKKVFDDPMIQRHFENRAWVKVGPMKHYVAFWLKWIPIVSTKCLAKETMVMDILLEGNVRILLTSRQIIEESSILRVALLDEEESKKLLGEKVFGENGFPPHLEKLGEKIAKKCEGLPLMIVIVAELLSKEDKTSEFWMEVAEKQHSEVFKDAYNQTSKINVGCVLIATPYLPSNKCAIQSKMIVHPPPVLSYVWALTTNTQCQYMPCILSYSGASAKSCTREILQKIPNLEGLEIQIELKPYDDDDDGRPLSGLGYISEELKNLNLLTCHILNPDMKYEYLVPLSMFSSSVTILRLSGLGCPWKHINDIGSLLPSLTNLVLTHYAFRGAEWDIESGHFLKLETLVIEDTDLVRWRAQHGSLPLLKLLSMRHCYKLRQLKWRHDSSIVTTCAIELVECNPLAVASAMQLRPKSHFKVRYYSSF
ncbi:putative late blight resistance protein homolog R1B-13 [Salvia splendens]|uniref:putative late blight resistance protein homolog R1B-13 n=1 Tax=Salvia splendens TaxID=180675 RepID=UPI001C25D57A|nr:putative late blight resistance protein homolog R1B-13 [Salvia splendens]